MYNIIYCVCLAQLFLLHAYPYSIVIYIIYNNYYIYNYYTQRSISKRTYRRLTSISFARYGFLTGSVCEEPCFSCGVNCNFSYYTWTQKRFTTASLIGKLYYTTLFIGRIISHTKRWRQPDWWKREAHIYSIVQQFMF